MNKDILVKEKYKADRLARRIFTTTETQYWSNLVSNPDGRSMVFTVTVSDPIVRQYDTVCSWETTCIVTEDGGNIKYRLYQGGRPIENNPDSLEKAIETVNSLREDYMQKGYRKLARRAMVLKRAAVLRAINSLPD